jgi:hypothetical protein
VLVVVVVLGVMARKARTVTSTSTIGVDAPGTETKPAPNQKPIRTPAVTAFAGWSARIDLSVITLHSCSSLYYCIYIRKSHNNIYGYNPAGE